MSYFVPEVPGNKVAKMVWINRHSAEKVYHLIRIKFTRECEEHSPFWGEVEVDESYFGVKKLLGIWAGGD